jgi:hypothetical protein
MISWCSRHVYNLKIVTYENTKKSIYVPAVLIHLIHLSQCHLHSVFAQSHAQSSARHSSLDPLSEWLHQTSTARASPTHRATLPSPARSRRPPPAVLRRLFPTAYDIPRPYDEDGQTLIARQVHPTGGKADQSTSKTHAKDGGDASIVPKKIQEIVPESVERALPNAIHDTGDK